MKKLGVAVSLFVASSFAFTLVSCKEAPQGDTAQNGGYVLPQPTSEFKGHIGTTYKDSTPDKIPIVNPPKGAPNVLVVLIDDAGYGMARTRPRELVFRAIAL